MEALKNGDGPFAELGIDVYDIYWKYYPRYTNPNKHYTSLEEFATWFLKQRPTDIELFRKFNYDDVVTKLEAFVKKM